MKDLERIRRLEDDLIEIKESFVKSEGWHKETFTRFRSEMVFWCKDEDAISDIDDVIKLIEQSGISG